MKFRINFYVMYDTWFVDCKGGAELYVIKAREREAKEPGMGIEEQALL